ncbi:uncharacterized protein Ecym_2740 [Eremothecium cymbalariae DBVPG|uniref:Uncharacterized protein n=1 Tax=Eremothecium cymbalariae (strain CBS 270.75 / DBVPG 7215 / KCTC 17166 / NRRL Y-17582) TaxID=931890 RepID=G8JPH3_ERECY|nr:Hypothetical protein Ecym_2740 [Eremothecium cymbalariae DBVPG\
MPSAASGQPDAAQMLQRIAYSYVLGDPPPTTLQRLSIGRVIFPGASGHTPHPLLVLAVLLLHSPTSPLAPDALRLGNTGSTSHGTLTIHPHTNPALRLRTFPGRSLKRPVDGKRSVPSHGSMDVTAKTESSSSRCGVAFVISVPKAHNLRRLQLSEPVGGRERTISVSERLEETVSAW